MTGLYSFADPPALPEGYGYDFVNADVVRQQLSVDSEGRLVTPSGMAYRLLYLGGTSTYMTLPVLKRLLALVEAGAVLVGDKPVASPSLADDADAFRDIAAQLFDTPRQNVYVGKTPSQVLAQLGVPRDFSYRLASSDAADALVYRHRQLPGADLYFVANTTGASLEVAADFRVIGREAELWNPETGAIEVVAWRREKNVTTVTFPLEAYGSRFVVFRNKSDRLSAASEAQYVAARTELEKGWTLSFPRQGGVAASGGTLESLGSWTESPDTAIRHFSGTAVYQRDFDVDQSWLASGSVFLNLGTAREIAEVQVNGVPLRTLWKPPYRVDISPVLRPGKNTLRIAVTNLWVNRLIGDVQPGATPVAATAVPSYLPQAPLQPSGLLGPVHLEHLQTR